MDPTTAVLHLIKKLGWTEAQIAEQIGLTQPSINRIRHGANPRYPTGVLLVNLAKCNRRAPT